MSIVYYDVPLLAGAMPSSGSMIGGGYVTVSGSGFGDDVGVSSYCRFGDLISSGTVLSSSLMRCDVPSSSSTGVVSLDVSVTGSDYSTGAVEYDYVPALSVSGLSPSRGPAKGALY